MRLYISCISFSYVTVHGHGVRMCLLLYVEFLYIEMIDLGSGANVHVHVWVVVWSRTYGVMNWEGERKKEEGGGWKKSITYFIYILVHRIAMFLQYGDMRHSLMRC